MAKKSKQQQSGRANVGPAGVFGELLEQGRYDVLRAKLRSGSDGERVDSSTKERLERLTNLDSVEMALAGITLLFVAVVYYLSL